MAFPRISNDIWLTIFEEFNEQFPHRLSELRLVSRVFNDLIIPIRYRTVLLTDPWMQSPQSPLHEIIEARVAKYTRHVKFQGGRLDAVSRDVNFQGLLGRCQRLQSITWVHVSCLDPLHGGEQAQLPDGIQAFMLGHPDIHLRVENMEFSEVTSLAALQICNANVQSIQVFTKGEQFGSLRTVLSHCRNLEDLELDAGGHHRFFVDGVGRLPPSIKRLTFKANNWGLHRTAARHHFDFSSLEELNLVTEAPLEEITPMFEHVPAPRLQTLRYVCIAEYWAPKNLRQQLCKQLYASFISLPKLQVLELKCNRDRVYLPGIFDYQSELRELDIGLQFMLETKIIINPTLTPEDVQSVQKLNQLEVLSVDLERHICDVDVFIKSLCKIPTLRSLTIRTGTVLGAEYSSFPNMRDPMGREAKNGEQDPDRRLAILIAKSVHKHRDHRLAELTIKLGGYREKVDWESREVRVVDGELERRMFVVSWNLWRAESRHEALLEEYRGQKIFESATVQL